VVERAVTDTPTTPAGDTPGGQTTAETTVEASPTPPPPAASVHRYEPRGTALTVMTTRAPELLVSGPAGTGKSRGCLEKLLFCALVNDAKNGHPFKGLIARKTGVSLTATTLATWKEYVAKEALASGVCVYYGGSREEPAQYRFANGSRIMLTGMDNPVKIMSSEFDLVYVGEATELSITDWEFITARLRNGRTSFQQVIADCNPQMPNHWLKTRLDTTGVVLHSAHWENPRYFAPVPEGTPPIPATGEVPPRVVEVHNGVTYQATVAGAQYLAKLQALTGVRKERLYYGRWVAAEGLVWDNWDPAVHVAPKKFTPPATWRRYWLIDFGYRNPFVCQWWAEDPDGRLWLYREIYRTGRLVEDHARDILRIVTRARKTPRLTRAENELFRADRSAAYAAGLCEWTEPQPVAIICDHDAEGRATLEKYLHRATTAARKDVKRGLEAVDARWKVRADGTPGLMLMPSVVVERDPALVEAGLPVCTEDEVGGYVWEPPKEGRAPKEEVVKQNDHGCDLIRYIVAHRDLRVRVRDRDHLLEG
jgi:hypothetical protein